MKKTIAFVLLCLGSVGGSTVLPQSGAWQAVSLPSGKILYEPPAGTFVGDLNAFPINSAISPNGRYLAFLNNGFGQSSSGFRKSIAVYDRTNPSAVRHAGNPGPGLAFDGPGEYLDDLLRMPFSSTAPGFMSPSPRRRRTPGSGSHPEWIRMYRGDRARPGAGRRQSQIAPAQVPFPKGIRLNNPAPTPSGISVMADPQNPGEDLIYAALTLSDAAVELSTKTRQLSAYSTCT